MPRAHYQNSFRGFLAESAEQTLGHLSRESDFPVEQSQVGAWLHQIDCLKRSLQTFEARGSVYFEYVLPRLGRRIDVLLVIDQVIFVLEFKVGEARFQRSALDQVWDYALDLKNFHLSSHDKPIVPLLVATKAAVQSLVWRGVSADGVVEPICVSESQIAEIIELSLRSLTGPRIDVGEWDRGIYSPTPTIVEAAIALYGGHAVEEISRSDAGAINLATTSKYLSLQIEKAKVEGQKVLCLLTGVPGAGKTLVGLDIANKHIDKSNDLYSVFLSGNGPLVAILREALARDKVRREKAEGKKSTKSDARRAVEMFVQNVHHFRDDCLRNATPPVEHVTIFDEAQRAWDRDQTSAFMVRKRGQAQFDMSEAEFLMSCMDRHDDWAVVICLVGGGQEIHTGEAGIEEWLAATKRRFEHWHVHLSPKLTDAEYGAGVAVDLARQLPKVSFDNALHLNTSMRSFRAEHVSGFVKQMLDIDMASANGSLASLVGKYPIVVTRDFEQARRWLRSQARGTERTGMVASSQALRLKPHAIDIRAPIDPVHWFLDEKDDVRSSYYLEDAATEFQVQGLELDWTCVVWDADFRFAKGQWEHWSFVGKGWQRIRKPERKAYLKNAYRVLLTRARQGMVVVVPPGSASDPTRDPSYYDSTFEYLSGLGLPTV